ncbi:MAG: hypothetical protein P8X90_33280, partial [Desulfobacterales bacterium]
MRFLSIYGGERLTLQNILDRGKTGVFISEKLGLVILVIPRDQNIREFRGDFRRFSLDSDLILGAITQENKNLAIVARERQTPLDVLPPLRFESIVGLAMETDPELAQSYERNNVAAGAIQNGDHRARNRDWAPIYLSDHLIDTELGSLLNITDQILKSWSEAGVIEYINFDYPKPKVFPFGQKRLSGISGGTNTLFNWNTSGVSEVLYDKDYQLFSINRTGSLPVTYGSDANTWGEIDTGMLAEYEEKAYDYFSSLGDHNLVRVVQYTALYQIFQAFPVEATDIQKRTGANSDLQTEKYLTGEIYATLKKIIDEEAVIQPAWLNGVLIYLQEDEEMQQIMSTYSGSNDDKRVALQYIFASRAEAQIEDTRRLLSELQSIGGNDLLFQFAGYLANPRRFQLSAETLAELSALRPEQLYEEIRSNRELRTILFRSCEKAVRTAFDIVADKTAICSGYAKSRSHKPASHIKTPSIVLSWDTQHKVIGGHNLDSLVTRIEVSSKVKPGTVRITKNPTGDDILLLNPVDINGSSRLARLYSRNRYHPQVRAIIEKAILQKQPVRNMGKALVIETSRDVRGLQLQEHENLLFNDRLGIRVPSEAVRTERLQEMKQIADEWGYHLVVDKIDDGYLVYRSYQSNMLEAKTTPALIEIIGETQLPLGSKSANLYFRNFSKSEVNALAKSAAIKQIVADGKKRIPLQSALSSRTRISPPGKHGKSAGGSGGKIGGHGGGRNNGGGRSNGGSGGKSGGNGGKGSGGGKEYSVNAGNKQLVIIRGKRNYKH